MHNQKTANIVKLNISTRKWYPTTIAYEDVSHNGCLLLWDEKKREQIEYRPCEIGTAEFCAMTAVLWNGLVSQ